MPGYTGFSPSAVLPLAGKHILVTRPARQAAAFSQRLEELGARVTCIPLIEIRPPENWDACDEAVGRISEYDSLLLSSANAAEAFFKRLLRTLPDSRAWKTMTLYAVGEKTRQAVDRFGVLSTVFDGVTDAVQLAERLISSGKKGTRFLFPKGNLARETLPEMLRQAGMIVDEVVVYETVPASEAASLEGTVFSGRHSVDVVTFFSPSSAEIFFSLVEKTRLAECAIAVIGATTADAVRRHGASVDILPDRPASEELARAIVRYCIHD